MSVEQAPRADRFYAYDTAPTRRRAAGALQRRRRFVWIVTWGLASILAGVVITFLFYAGLFERSAETVEEVRPVTETVNVGDMTFTGFDKKNQAYSISANSAEQDDDKPNIIHLKEVKAEMHLRRKDDVVYVTSERGIYDTETEMVRLESNIRLTSTNDYSAVLETADVMLKEGRVHSDGPVVVSLSGGTIWSNALDMSDRGKRIVFKNRIRVLFKADDETPATAGENDDKPVEIEADTMEFIQEKKQAVFTGDVNTTKDGIYMQSQTLVADYSEVDGKREVTFLNARGDVVVVSQGQTVKAQWTKMDVRADTVVMGDKVTVVDGKSVITGQRLEIGKQAVFTGTVDARKGSITMRSQTLVADFNEAGGKREITFLNARGNVVVVTRGQTVRAQWARMNVRTDAVVMGDSVTVVDGKTVIKGRRLEIKEQAVISGDVDATKGNVNMKSETLVVDYTEVGRKREVTHLNARGNVVVVSKDQTVKAQWAKMDVKANTVVMGDQVTVIDGKSVVKGRRLERNLTTGESRLLGGRVQGTFFQ